VRHGAVWPWLLNWFVCSKGVGQLATFGKINQAEMFHVDNDAGKLEPLGIVRALKVHPRSAVKKTISENIERMNTIFEQRGT
jgi:hypothetical protein